MSLATLREKQKLVMWIVIILIVPPFVIYFGAPQDDRQGGENPTILSVLGKKIRLREAQKLQRRLDATGGRWVYRGARERSPYSIMFQNPSETYYRETGFRLLHAKLAEQSGVDACDQEISDTIRYDGRFRVWQGDKPGPFDEARFKKYLSNVLRMTPLEYKMAVRTRLALMSFEDMVDGSGLASPFEAYSIWARQHTAFVHDTVEVKAEAFTDAARESIEDMDTAVVAWMDAHADDPSLRNPSRWRLEYVAQTFDDIPEPEFGFEEVEDYYKERRKEYDREKVEFPKDIELVRQDMMDDHKRAMAVRPVRDTVGELVTAAAAAAAGPDGETGATLTAEKVMSDPRLAKRLVSGSTGGTSGELLTPEALLEHPVIGGSPDLEYFLRGVASMGDEDREKLLADLSRSFSSMGGISFGGADSANRGGSGVFVGDDAAFRIRVLAFDPGSLRDPSTDEEVREMVEDEVVREKALEMAEEYLGELRAELQASADGSAEGDLGGSGAPETVTREKRTPWSSAPESLRGALVGEAGEPVRVFGGYRMHILRRREAPSFAEFNRQPAETREQFRNRALMQSRGYGPFRARTRDGGAEFRRMCGERLQELDYHAAFEAGDVEVLVDFSEDAEDDDEG